MPKLAVYNQQGESVGEISLADSVFGVEPNQQVIYDVVKAQTASMRQGTAKVKNRSAVSGGGRKPYRQKGTGRARQGSIRSPQWVGGGVVFGPTPRSYDYKVNKKIRRLALKIVLSDKVREEKMIVLDSLNLETFKTKGMIQVLDNLKTSGKTIIVLDEMNENCDIASRNLPNVVTMVSDHISVYDVMNASVIVATENAIKKIEEALS
ncbi:MAG: 50S ribosomal protein L4 [Candidatus Izemoplasmatales bacterium]|nr:50S ribosomal protein L4 [Candidatus Izemoplasmatales bacterium]MDD4354563.1 50S ribosomal protein L4 [Candidatus Izemoplasmatales bacterium]MDD4988045.1 50S ribosomal protein L4 [Candidatus Izemoplasmatales bacterium]MDY0372802.1 50S ribosomal protein L4 [Candidatus Izemoplasmatales bacterium]NLF48441.1 50S ribosomal protein L4 [Acholeplasmataceae bacterium]